MKFDPMAWQEVSPNEEISVKGRLQLRCSAPSPLYIQSEGIEALAGVATEFHISDLPEVIARVDAAPGVRIFVHRGYSSSVRAEGEVFTNIDRMVHESGAMQEVTRARRLFEIERRAALAEMRAEHQAFTASLRSRNDDAASEVLNEDVADADAEVGEEGVAT